VKIGGFFFLKKRNRFSTILYIITFLSNPAEINNNLLIGENEIDFDGDKCEFENTWNGFNGPPEGVKLKLRSKRYTLPSLLDAANNPRR